MDNNTESLFKNELGEKEYFIRYKACLREWPVPYIEQYIDTSFGRTYLLVSGNKNGKPIVLFHGMAASPASWYPNISVLSKKYKIYVPNYPGDFGLSDFNKSPLTPIQAAEWVNELFLSLQLSKPIIMGTSFGAFLCTNYSINYPDKIDKLILISPAGVFSSINMAFYIKLVFFSLFSKQLNIRKLTKWFFAPHNFICSPFTELFEAAITYGIPKLKYPPSVFSFSELRKINCPVLLLLGYYEVISNLKKTIKCATQSIRNLSYKVIPNAGHLLPIEQYDIVNQEVSHFI